MKVKIIQCLCGPARHCMMAEAFEDHDKGCRDEDRLSLFKNVVSGLIGLDYINPWCGICGARADGWRYETQPTLWASLEEAMPHLERSQREQMEGAEILRREGRTFDVIRRN